MNRREIVELKQRLQGTSREAIDGTIAKNRLDALVAITAGPARPIHLRRGGDVDFKVIGVLLM